MSAGVSGGFVGQIFHGVFKLHVLSFVFAAAISAQLSDELDRVELLVSERNPADRHGECEPTD